jgi:hypothetical protein
MTGFLAGEAWAKGVEAFGGQAEWQGVVSRGPQVPLAPRKMEGGARSSWPDGSLV